jgi:hypothetical protein
MDEQELTAMKECKMTFKLASFILLLMGFDGEKGHALLDDFLP